MRGDIATVWAGRAKEYSWSLCADLAPRNITPTDIDYAVECNRKFAFFEMKTTGHEMPTGQARMFDNLLLAHNGNALLFVVEHTELARVQLPTDVLRFYCRIADKSGGVRSSRFFLGAAFPMVYTGFFAWAENRKRLKDIFEEAETHAGWLADYEREERKPLHAAA